MPEKTQPQRTVLVVEEEVSIGAAVAESLRGSGFQVLEAASGAEAPPLSRHVGWCRLLAHADAWRSRQLHASALAAREQTQRPSRVDIRPRTTPVRAKQQAPERAVQ